MSKRLSELPTDVVFLGYFLESDADKLGWSTVSKGFPLRDSNGLVVKDTFAFYANKSEIEPDNLADTKSTPNN